MRRRECVAIVMRPRHRVVRRQRVLVRNVVYGGRVNGRVVCGFGYNSNCME